MLSLSCPSLAFYPPQPARDGAIAPHWSSRLLGLVLLSTLATGLPLFPLLAQGNSQTAPPATPPTAKPQQPPNTLEMSAPDPLLPTPEVKRLLSPLEKVELRKALDKLNTDAQAARTNGDRSTAYATWFRELRLRRFLSPDDELSALARVGQTAWDDNQRLEVQLITRRLEQLQRQKDPALTPSQQAQLGSTYEIVRAMPQAIAYHEAVLQQLRSQPTRPNLTPTSPGPNTNRPNTNRPNTNRPNTNRPSTNRPSPTEESTLTTLASLYLNSFNYPKAAERTQDLLKLSRAKDPKTQLPREELIHLETLVFIYEKDRQYPQAIATQTQLLEQYQTPLEANKIPSLKHAIALNQEASGQLIAATQTYQDAYTSALALQQLSIAQTAAQNLAELYERQKQPLDALKVYTILQEVNQRSYNLYGLLDTHSRMGDLYLSQQQPEPARRAFQQALHLARQLKYREAEITQKLQPLTPTQPQ